MIESRRTAPLILAAAIALVVAAASCSEAAGPIRTAAQRIDDAAAAIAKTLGRTPSEVKSTFRATIDAGSEEAFATSLEGIAAKPTWTTKVWTAAKTTVALAKNDEAKFVGGLICEALDQWDNAREVTESDLRHWASQLTNLDPGSPANVRIADIAKTTLESQDKKDLAYVNWLHAVTCLIDKIPE
jgi:hypothetical protein